MQRITLVFSGAPALIMTTPTVFPSYFVNNDIESNKYGIAILNNTTLGIFCTQKIQTKCTGKHCDCQILHEIFNQVCQCWGTSGIGIANFSLLRTFVVDYRTSIFTVKKFSSKNSIWIFQGKYFPQTVPLTALEHTDARDNIEDAIGNCVDSINDNGRFMVVMWYSKGEINYK